MIARSHVETEERQFRDIAPMKVERSFKRMRIQPRNGGLYLHIGEMEIWDGADLALLREGLAQLIERERAKAVTIEMGFVKYIPSGFFGMLFDWTERKNVKFFLTPPQANVQQMLWFRQFFDPTDDGRYRLEPKGVIELDIPADTPDPLECEA